MEWWCWKLPLGTIYCVETLNHLNIFIGFARETRNGCSLWGRQSKNFERESKSFLGLQWFAGSLKTVNKRHDPTHLHCIGHFPFLYDKSRFGIKFAYCCPAAETMFAGPSRQSRFPLLWLNGNESEDMILAVVSRLGVNSGFTNCFEWRDCGSHSVVYSSKHLIRVAICLAGHSMESYCLSQWLEMVEGKRFVSLSAQIICHVQQRDIGTNCNTHAHLEKYQSNSSIQRRY